MPEKNALDNSRLLGFDRDGDPLWGVCVAGDNEQGTAKPSGTAKPLGIAKPEGVIKDGDDPVVV